MLQLCVMVAFTWLVVHLVVKSFACFSSSFGEPKAIRPLSWESVNIKGQTVPALPWQSLLRSERFDGKGTRATVLVGRGWKWQIDTNCFLGARNLARHHTTSWLFQSWLSDVLGTSQEDHVGKPWKVPTLISRFRLRQQVYTSGALNASKGACM